MRGGHCLTAWTKKQQVVSLSISESELYAGSENSIRGIGNPERGEGPGHCMRVELASARHGTDGPGQHTRSLQVEEVRHEEGGYEREPRRLDDETVARAEDRSAHENHGLRIRGTASEETIDGELDRRQGEGEDQGRRHGEMKLVVHLASTCASMLRLSAVAGVELRGIELWP